MFWTIISIIGWLVLLAGMITLVTSLTKESGVDWAPGWQLRCSKCSHHKAGKDVGMIRLGAVGKKYTLGYCSRCDRLRWIVIERAPQQGSLYQTGR